MLPKLLKKLKNMEHFPNSFYKAIITLVLKLDKDTTGQKVNNRAMSLVSIHAEVLNKDRYIKPSNI